MAHRQRIAFGSLAAAAVMATALAQTSTVAGAAPSAAEPGLAPGMVTAMQRDLGLTKAEATERVADEARAATAQTKLEQSLGADFAGAWFDAEAGTLLVGVTSSADIAAVEAAGAEAQLVAHTTADLDWFSSELGAAQTPAAVSGWYADVTTNQIVIETSGTAAEAAAFATAAGVPATAVRVQTAVPQPQPLINVVGGNSYTIDGQFNCSVGFTVGDGFITAGHCGNVGSTTVNPTGRFIGSSFPGNDYAYVRVGTGNTLFGTVNNYSGGSVAVRGSTEAPIGASICRSGQTTGWYCGTIQARNSTVNYAEGSVTGLIRTSVCAEPGDSGGSAISGNQAQGVTSGGSGNCRTGGTTYFQPVNEILSVYGLTLRTS